MLKTEGYENSQLFMALTPKNGVKASKLYSYKPIDGTGDFVWTRNSTAYRMNQEGVLELMGSNVPRVDYTNTCPELLIEKASTNYFTYSEQFDNADWAKTNVTVTANSINAPNGSLVADLISYTNATNSLVNGTTLGGDNTVTFSVYAKAGTTNVLRIRETFYFGTSTTFNLTTGTVLTGAGVIESVGDGWYRCSLTQVYGVGDTVVQCSFDSNTNIGNLYLWGAQLEESDYATSYIPTTTTSVTRPKDVCYNTANGYNDADWSVVMRVRLNNIGSSADEPLLALSDGTTDYYFAIYTDSNPKLHFTWYNNPDQDTYSTTDLSNGIVNVGVSFDSVTAEYIIVIDGTMEFAGTLVNNAPGLFGNFNRLDLGSIVGTGSPDKDGIIGIQYYDSALSQSSLENLTA